MKKKIMSLIAIVCALALLGGCGGSKISNEYLTIKQYKGLEVEKKEVVAVTDEDVEGSIEQELLALATYTDITDRAAQLGDVTTIDYSGKKDGVAFEGGTAQDQTLELGSKTFIDGFEDGVVGHKIGETFDLNLTFPKDYHSEDLAGKAVVFTVTLKGIQEKNVPELTDELLPEIGTKATTVAEYKEQVRKDLEASNKAEAEAQLQSAVWEALIAECTVNKFPDGVIDSYVKQLEEDYYYYAYYYGMETAELIQTMYGMSIEELAKLQITKQLAVELVAEKEGIKVSDDEYKTLLEEYATEQGYATAEECETAVGKDGLKQMFLEEKVMELLMKHCVYVAPKADK